jgi:hypothetical protein
MPMEIFDDAGEQVMTIGATSSSPVNGTVSIQHQQLLNYKNEFL